MSDLRVPRMKRWSFMLQTVCELISFNSRGASCVYLNEREDSFYSFLNVGRSVRRCGRPSQVCNDQVDLDQHQQHGGSISEVHVTSPDCWGKCTLDGIDLIRQPTSGPESDEKYTWNVKCSVSEKIKGRIEPPGETRKINDPD